MTKAEAKRHACRYAAAIVYLNAYDVGDFYEPYDDWNDTDRGRFQDALVELSEELSRRAGPKDRSHA